MFPCSLCRWSVLFIYPADGYHVMADQYAPSEEADDETAAEIQPYISWPRSMQAHTNWLAMFDRNCWRVVAKESIREFYRRSTSLSGHMTYDMLPCFKKGDNQESLGWQWRWKRDKLLWLMSKAAYLRLYLVSTGTKQQCAMPATDISYKSLAISSVKNEK